MTETVRFIAGAPITGYQFDAHGNVVRDHTYTFKKNSSAQSDSRAACPNREGEWLHFSAGEFKDLWVREATDVVVSEPKIVPVVFTPPPVDPPPVDPPPTTGKPWDLFGNGAGNFKKDFADGAMAPFKERDYPDLHLGQPGQFMTVYNRFSLKLRRPTVHDGYLDLRATRTSDPDLWDADLVATSQAGDGPTFGYGDYRFWVTFNPGPGTWQSTWLYDTTTWSADEIDWEEMLENQHLVAHVLGMGAGSVSGQVPGDIATVPHCFLIQRRPAYTAFGIDEKEVGRVSKPQSSKKLAIMLDSKVGFAWMGSDGQITPQTPDPTYLHVYAVTFNAA